MEKEEKHSTFRRKKRAGDDRGVEAKRLIVRAIPAHKREGWKR